MPKKLSRAGAKLMFDKTSNHPNQFLTQDLISEIQLTSQEKEITFEEAQELVIDFHVKQLTDELPF